MNKRIALLLCLVLALPLLAQEKPKESGTVYKLEYTVTEMDGTKKLSIRSYTLLLANEKDGRLRLGSRVPITVKEDQIQYQDVGANIDAYAKTVEGSAIMLRTRLEMSSLAMGEAGTGRRPVFRTLNNALETIVPLDKPTLLTSQDEPGSSSSFQVSVTARIVK